jgi:hypothetical protein
MFSIAVTYVYEDTVRGVLVQFEPLTNVTGRFNGDFVRMS